MIGFAAAMYRTVIRLYPSGFWREFHEELEDDFADGSREALDSGRPVLAIFWLRALGDLCRSLAREWLRTPWLPVLIVAGALSITMFTFTALEVSRWPPPVFRRVRAQTDPDSESLKAIIVMTVGVLIPIVGAILGSLWTMQLRRRSMSSQRRRHV